MAAPDFCRVFRLDRQCPVTCLTVAATIKKAAHADFIAYAMNIGNRHAIESHSLLKGYLAHQLIDVYVSWFLACHATGNGSVLSSAMVRFLVVHGNFSSSKTPH